MQGPTPSDRQNSDQPSHPPDSTTGKEGWSRIQGEGESPALLAWSVPPSAAALGRLCLGSFRSWCWIISGLLIVYGLLWPYVYSGILGIWGTQLALGAGRWIPIHMLSLMVSNPVLLAVCYTLLYRSRIEHNGSLRDQCAVVPNGEAAVRIVAIRRLICMSVLTGFALHMARTIAYTLTGPSPIQIGSLLAAPYMIALAFGKGTVFVAYLVIGLVASRYWKPWAFVAVIPLSGLVLYRVEAWILLLIDDSVIRWDYWSATLVHLPVTCACLYRLRIELLRGTPLGSGGGERGPLDTREISPYATRAWKWSQAAVGLMALQVSMLVFVFGVSGAPRFLGWVFFALIITSNLVALATLGFAIRAFLDPTRQGRKALHATILAVIAMLGSAGTIVLMQILALGVMIGR